MPKSRQRKDHKKKSLARTRRVQAERNRYQKLMQAAMMEQIEKMRAEQSGTTESNESVQQTV
jgi:hypothetical protein